MAEAKTHDQTKGILGWVERTGNKLPDPVFLFAYFIIALVIISIICAMLGVNATLTTRFLAACQTVRKRGSALVATELSAR